MTEHEIIDSFENAMRSVGISPPDKIDADGQLHRFSTNGRRNDTAGYYVLHLDGIPAGLFGCWRSGVEQKWKADIGRSLTPSENAQMAARAAEMRAARDRQRQEENDSAAASCATVWGYARYSKDHPYLRYKGMDGFDLGVKAIDSIDPCVQKMFWGGDSWLDGSLLLIPIIDEHGEMVSLQAIDHKGNKSFARKGRKRAGFHLIGKIDESGVVLLGEGLATVWAAQQLVGEHKTFGCVAFDAGNLEPVAKVLRSRFPRVTIVVLADMDANGRGEQESKKAAQAVHGAVWAPKFTSKQREDGLTDFWDLWRGE